MAAFLHILSIIAYVLLGILGLVLLVLALVLFFPIGYKVKAYYKSGDDYSFIATGGWLFHLLHFSFDINRDEKFILRILGIKLKKKEKPDDEKEIKIKEKPTGESEKESEKIEDDFNPEKVEADDKSDNNGLTKNGKYDKIKKYIELIKSDLFERAFDKAKDSLVRLLKHILPRKWNLDAIVGFEDPSVTGQILVYYSALIPFIASHVHVKGDFENVVTDVKLDAKGRITLIVLLTVLLSAYFNKDIKRVIKLLREV
jgi:hypothetical protein